MWYKTIRPEVLRGTSSWKIEQYRQVPNVDRVKGGTPIKDIAVERLESIDPTKSPYRELPYLGLDAVESGTGEVLQVRSALDQEIRSRSRVFKSGDVLYGRLRAYLNKVALIEANLPIGSCSGEFYVLTPNQDVVSPRYLQWLLSSNLMLEYVNFRLAGATHPRLSIEDLMNYRVHLPPKAKQELAVKVIEDSVMNRRQLRASLNELPRLTLAAVEQIIQES